MLQNIVFMVFNALEISIFSLKVSGKHILHVRVIHVNRGYPPL